MKKRIEVIALVHWQAPLTSGCYGILEIGDEIETVRDIAPGAQGFSARPVNAKEFEEKYVKEATELKYDGYTLSILASLIGDALEPVES